MTTATKRPTRQEYERVTFKAPSRQEYEKGLEKKVVTPPPSRPRVSGGSDIYGAFDVWAAPPDSQIWKSPGAKFTEGFGAGWLKQTQLPALMGKKLPPPVTKAEKIGEMGGRMTEAITELIGLGAILRGAGLLSGTVPKGAALGKALRTGFLFGTQQVTEEARKATAEAIYGEDFGSRGGIAVMESFALGAILSLAGSGIGRVWSKLRPSEQAQALKTLGLKKGASLHEISKAARREAFKYHPDKVKGMREQFDKVINARDMLRKAKAGDVIIANAKQNFKKQLMFKVGVSEDVANTAIKRLDAGEPIVKVDQMLSQAKVLGKVPLTEAIVAPSKPVSTRKAPEAVEVVAPEAKKELIAEEKQLRDAINRNMGDAINTLFKIWPTIGKELGISRNELVDRGAAFVFDTVSDVRKGLRAKGRMDVANKFNAVEAEHIRLAAKLDINQAKLLEIEPEAVEVAKPLVKAEPVKPKGKPGFVDVAPLLKAHKTFMNIVEPSKALEIKLGKEPYAAVIKGIHQTDVGSIEFNEAQIEGQDKSIRQLGEWFNKFTDKDLKNFMLSRGEPTTVNAQLIQRDARNKLPKELRRSDLFNAVQRIADSNYKYLQSVAGDDIHRVEDYFHGIYKNPKAVDKFLDYWRTTKRFTKEKKLPTVADAIDYGLELRNYNPVANLREEYVAISHLEGMNWLRDELLRTGKGKFIDDMLEAPLEWDMVHDPIFKELRLQPDLAKLINNLIATNKITRIPLANTLREINNVARTVKFIGSAFHLLSVAKQSIADSGYLGFLYKPTALRGFTGGFRANDPVFKTTAYKDYTRHGGGHRYSVESEARRTFNRAVDELNRNMGIAVKVGALPLKIPTGFVNWMFQSYIPKVKYAKFLDVVAEKEKKLGRKLISPEKIDIIKEQQNFYGMMNERLFGRSGTVTSALRFYFMSPGYAEGNYRTMLKAATQWGGKGGFKANRSRSNIINSWLITATAATVATLAFTGKPPKKPETLDDARDLFKIDTGKVDAKGRKIMIDLMTYDKDYWNVAFNTLRLRPDVAIGKSWYRIGGMKAPTAEIIHDLTGMMMGKAILDWKNDRIYNITDPFLQKIMKLTVFEVKKLLPISVSVFQQSKKRDIDTTIAAIETLMGFRPTKTEKDIREQKIISKMYSLAGQREELSYYIGQSTNPKRTVERYNKTVNDILNSPYVPKSMKDEWGPKLLVDYEKVVTWKRFPAGKMTNAELQRAFDAHTLSVPYKRKGEPFRPIGEPKKGSERRVSELKAEAEKRGIELSRGPRKKPRR